MSRVGLPRALAVLAFLVPTGTLGAPGAGHMTEVPRRPTSPYAAANADRARAQAALPRKQASPPAPPAEAKAAPTQVPPPPGAAAQAKPAPAQAPPRPAAAARAKHTPTTQAPPRPAPAASEARAASDRVVAATHARVLFAQHTWVVPKPAPPPPPPPPPEPPPPPTAPPLPFTFLGSYAPRGEKPVYFLARGDRVVDARVGDKLDGVYELESAAGGQLVFVYLPLDIRQHLAAGASK